MSGACSSYAIAGDASSGPCLHHAGYQDAGSNDWCACHYGEPYDPSECGSDKEGAEAMNTENTPTTDEYRKAYELWKADGQKMYRILQDIWRYVTPGDTKDMTFGDPEDVLEAVRQHDREVTVKALEDAAEFFGKEQVDGLALRGVPEWLHSYVAAISEDR